MLTDNKKTALWRSVRQYYRAAKPGAELQRVNIIVLRRGGCQPDY